MLYIKDVIPHDHTALLHSYVAFECQVKSDLEPYYIEWLYHNIGFKNVNDANLDDGITIQVPTQNLKLSAIIFYSCDFEL